MSAPDYDELRFVAGSVSRETFNALLEFEAIFQKWAARINLVAPSTLGEVWRRHILDSAQLAKLEPEARQWLDLGSGGGFPGVVLAILLRDRPGASIDLVESNAKKAAFLRAAIGQLGAAGRVHVVRIEDCWDAISAPEIVTARALAPLPKLLALTAPWLEAGGKGLFHKGREYSAEIEESSDEWVYDLVKHPSLIDADSVILEVSRPRRR